MVRTLGFHCHDPGSTPGCTTQILQDMWRGQKKKKKLKSDYIYTEYWNSEGNFEALCTNRFNLAELQSVFAKGWFVTLKCRVLRKGCYTCKLNFKYLKNFDQVCKKAPN